MDNDRFSPNQPTEASMHGPCLRCALPYPWRRVFGDISLWHQKDGAAAKRPRRHSVPPRKGNDRSSPNLSTNTSMHSRCPTMHFSILGDVSLGTFLSGTQKTVPPRDVSDDTPYPKVSRGRFSQAQSFLCRREMIPATPTGMGAYRCFTATQERIGVKGSVRSDNVPKEWTVDS